MPVAPIAAFLAMALAASPQPPPQSARVASVPDAATGVMLNALPPPPSKVVRTTRTYGTVTLDHAAHLARKISCKSCHGSGAVTKIEFTPRLAHDTCRSCHVQVAKGPTDCRGCHVVPPKEPAQPALAAAAPAPAAASPAGSSAPSAPAAGVGTGTLLAGSASPSAVPAPAAAPVDDGADGGAAPFIRTVEAGLSVVAGSDQGVVAGPTIRVTSRYERAVLSHSLEWVGGRSQGRALFLLGGGTTLPLRDRMSLILLGLGGVDASGSDVVLMPALGARVGVEWYRAIPAAPWIDTLTISVAGLSDLVRRRNAFGEREGGTLFAFTVASGFKLGQLGR